VSDRKDPQDCRLALYDKVTLQDVAAPLEIFAPRQRLWRAIRRDLGSLTGKAVDTTSFVALNVHTPSRRCPTGSTR